MTCKSNLTCGLELTNKVLLGLNEFLTNSKHEQYLSKKLQSMDEDEWTTRPQIKTITPKLGYNFIKDPFPRVKVSKGDFIGWTGEGKIAISEEDSNLGLNDTEIRRSDITHYIRVFMSISLPTTIFHKYIPGEHNMTIYNKQYDLKAESKRFLVIAKVEEVSIKTKVCIIDTDCLIEPLITPSEHVGEVSLVWGGSCKDEFGTEIEKVNVTTTNGSLTYRFTKKARCFMTIDLTAITSHIKYEQKEESIAVNEKIQSPRILAPNEFTNGSLSKTGEPANFVFTLKTGSNYICTCDFSDGMGLLSITGDLLNMEFSRVFEKDGKSTKLFIFF